MEYSEDSYLMISGIQSFAFCKRQWALTHVENQWHDNILTYEGELLHKKAHDASKREKRGKIITTRSLQVSSRELGIYGVCDVVEFHENINGIFLPEENGYYKVVPVEYKRGKVKPTNIDELQLMAQAYCLEEMLCCKIDVGYIYYGEPKKREKVMLENNLREDLIKMVKYMHELYEKKHTPKVKTSKACKSCSLVDICLPMLCKDQSTKKYLDKFLGE